MTPPKRVISSISTLQAFDPETTTWSSYRDRLSFYFSPNTIDGATDKKALFLWSVGDQVYTLLESLVVPRLLTDTELTYDELIKLLDTHFDDSKNIISSTYTFFSCHQKPGQTFADWRAELYKLARRCGFTTSQLHNKPMDRAIRDMLVIGVQNPKVHQALLKEADPDLATTEKTILAAERLESDA